MALHRNALNAGHKLHWYEIESILGQGGFGITYLARDPNLDQLVAIKEFVPIELAVRDADSSLQPVSSQKTETYGWGLTRFLSEAQTLARFRHPNIVRVLSVFESNNTAYMVMEYERGESLEDELKFQRLKGEEALLNLLFPLLDGLALVHESGFIHRDIKPDNIFLRADGTPVLLDFGSARQALGVATRTLTTLVSPGFAPFEQYNATRDSDRQGPWTDIYALGATMYRAVTGKGPPDAIVRANAAIEGRGDPFVTACEEGAGEYSTKFLTAIDAALNFLPENRPQNIMAWQAMFPRRTETSSTGGRIVEPMSYTTKDIRDAPKRVEEESPAVQLKSDSQHPPEPVSEPIPPAPALVESELPPRRRRPLGWIFAAAMVIVAGALAYWYHAQTTENALPEVSTEIAAEAVGESQKSTDVSSVATSTSQIDPQGTESLDAALSELTASRDSTVDQEAPPDIASTLTKSEAAEVEKLAQLQQLQRDEEDALEALRAEKAQQQLELEALTKQKEDEQRLAQLREEQEKEQARLSTLQALQAQEQDKLSALKAEQEVLRQMAEKAALEEQVRTAEAEAAAQKAQQAVLLEQQNETTTVEDVVADTVVSENTKVTELLVLGDAALASARLTTPQGRSAFDYYQSVLTIDPTNAGALAGKKAIVERYLALASQARDKGAYDKARAYLARAGRVAPNDAAVAQSLSQTEQAQTVTLAKKRQQEEEVAEQAAALLEQQAAARKAQQTQLTKQQAEQELAEQAEELDRLKAEQALKAQLQSTATEQSNTSSQTASKGPQRLALIQFETSRVCHNPRGVELRRAVESVVSNSNRVQINYSDYRDDGRKSAVGKHARLWTGNLTEKSPNIEQVRALADRLEVDAVVMAWIKCAHLENLNDENFPFEIWVIDKRSGKTFHALDQLWQFDRGARNVFQKYFSVI